jgi:hypothetical protein
MSSAFGAFAAHEMTAASALVFDLAGSGNFDPFLQALMGFLLWHLTSSFKKTRLGNYKLCNLSYLQVQVKLKGAIFPKKERI